MNLKELKDEFPREKVSWRSQSITKNGDKALAIAYIDARDVMERLDDTCGPENWQDRYEVHGQKTICYLSIKLGDDWITKADGAGDTAVEAQKGSMSDAFKRAAVKWGIGRYLYDLPAQWVPCESYQNSQGKNVFKRFTADPWQRVPQSSEPKPSKNDETRTIYSTLQEVLRGFAPTTSPADLLEWAAKQKEQMDLLPADWRDDLRADFSEILKESKALEVTKTKEAA